MRLELDCVWGNFHRKFRRKRDLKKSYFQEKPLHLELLEGVMIDILKIKWNHFVKRTYV